MKKCSLFLALLLALLVPACCLTGCADRTPTAPAEDATAGEDAPGGEGGVALADFTVETADGGSFTLSKALEDHQLVLINLWATWCGWCTVEFPYLQEAYEQNKDSVAVIALSVESGDSAETIRDYARENGLTFPMGSALGTGLESYADNGIPVSLVVDRDGCVRAVELGAKTSTEAFNDLFAACLDMDNTGEQVYTVRFTDADGAAVPGCTVTFCTDELCVPATAGEDGVATFTGDAAEGYTVKLIGWPEGYDVAGDAELAAGPGAREIEFRLEKVS